jgi:predicted small lipoprotein YifL
LGEIILKKNTVLSISSFFAALLLLSACGQKGPLYLPEKKASAPTTAPTPVQNTNVESQAASNPAMTR